MKSGKETTEWGLTVFVLALGAALMLWGNEATAEMGGYMVMVAVGGYAVSRGLAKVGAK